MKGRQKKTSDKSAQEKLPLKKRIVREIVAWGWVLAAFLVIHGTLVQARVIPSPSMEQTLLVGDHFLVSRFGYDAGLAFTDWHVSLWRSPQRQQIVVFRSVTDRGTDLVKRVIGVPGDRIEIRRGVVWVNGQPLVEPYVNGKPNPTENREPVIVPEKSYFVMCDNRENSYDSRYWGFLPRSNIVGTPMVIYMSIEGPAEAFQPGHVGERLSAYLNALVHPQLVRWSRLFVTF